MENGIGKNAEGKIQNIISETTRSDSMAVAAANAMLNI